MVIPEINPEHLEVIPFQKQRLGTSRGFIAVKSNCSIQSYVPALSPLREEFGLERVLACTYQAISGAGKTFGTWPEMVDNVIPYIGGEEEKSEREPMKVWGSCRGRDDPPRGQAAHHRAVLPRGGVERPHGRRVRQLRQEAARGRDQGPLGGVSGAVPQELGLPSAPQAVPASYFEEPDRPQTRLDRMNEGGMQVIDRPPARGHAVRLQVRLPFSHNTLRGAAGGAVELAELLCAEGYIVPQIRLQVAWKIKYHFRRYVKNGKDTDIHRFLHRHRHALS